MKALSPIPPWGVVSPVPPTGCAIAATISVFSMPRCAYHQRYLTDVSSFLHSHCHQLSHWHIFIAACFGTLSMLLDNSDLSSVHPQCCLISVHVHLHRCQPLLHNKRRLPSMHSHRTALPRAHYPATADVTAQRCYGHTLTLTNVQCPQWHLIHPAFRSTGIPFLVMAFNYQLFTSLGHSFISPVMAF